MAKKNISDHPDGWLGKNIWNHPNTEMSTETDRNYKRFSYI